MAAVVGAIANGYTRMMTFQDPRVKDFFLMESPLPTVIICISYIYFVLSLGPRFMRDRKPFQLRGILIVYNAAQTLLSIVLFYLSVKQWVATSEDGIGLTCKPVDQNSYSEEDLWTTRLCHAYYLSKITELADTVFFILKKKNNHVSLLHVFHHAAMPFSVWVGVKFAPGGNLAFFGLPNLFVHIWMYMYYMVAAMGPKYQKYIWWKRHITEMQLAQFALVMFYMLYVSFTCQYNKVLITWIFVLDSIFVFLFVDFYRKTYIRNKQRKEAKEALANGGDSIVHNGVKEEPVRNNGTANGTAMNGSAKKME